MPDTNGPRALVTVLMPCRFASVIFLGRALDSILSQTSQRWNLLVIYDGIAPEIRSILEDLASRNDKKVSVIPNEGRYISGALNTGMKHARTPYVSALHCDDLLDPKAVEVLSHNIAKYPAVDFFYSSRMAIDEQDRPISGVMKAVDFTLADFKKKCVVKHLHCWKVSAARQIGGVDETLGPHGADDYDFPWCMAEAGFLFKTISECLYYYRDHREYYRLTTHVPLDTQLTELRKILKKHRIPEYEIEKELRERSSGYLRQALFLNHEDRKKKELERFDVRTGWHLPYSSYSSPERKHEIPNRFDEDEGPTNNANPSKTDS